MADEDAVRAQGKADLAEPFPETKSNDEEKPKTERYKNAGICARDVRGVYHANENQHASKAEQYATNPVETAQRLLDRDTARMFGRI